jgi:hypothetical protein
MSLSVAGFIAIRAPAIASRAVSFLPETSTMRAAPSLSKWASFFIEMFPLTRTSRNQIFHEDIRARKIQNLLATKRRKKHKESHSYLRLLRFFAANILAIFGLNLISSLLTGKTVYCWYDSARRLPSNAFIGGTPHCRHPPILDMVLPVQLPGASVI